RPLLLFAVATPILIWVAYRQVASTQAQSPPQPQAGAAPGPRTAIRIGFGERQDRETDYSGVITLSDGQVTELIPWRFFDSDQIQGGNAWKLFTRRANMENQPDQPRPIATAGANQNVVPKAVSAVVDAPATATASIQTG